MAATMTGVLSLGAVVPAAAQGPATLRGQVYFCNSREPLPGAAVSLVSTDGTTSMNLRSDANGRFVRVGLPAGTYRVETSQQVGRHVFSSRRLARLEADDVLDVPLGVTSELTSRHCEPYLVPPALPTTDRYIVH